MVSIEGELRCLIVDYGGEWWELDGKVLEKVLSKAGLMGRKLPWKEAHDLHATEVISYGKVRITVEVLGVGDDR